MTTVAEAGVEAWHRVLRRMSPEALDDVLADDVVFHSPVVHTPQRGRALAKLYLLAAYDVLPGDGAGASARPTSGGTNEGSFRYVREIVGERDAMLEFVTEVEGITINGIDLIRWNDEGRIVDFKVMVRPLKAIQKVHARMAERLARMSDRAGPPARDA